MAERFGVKTAKLTPGMFNEVIKVSGQIVPAPDDQVVISARSSGIVTFAHGCRVNSGATIATLSSKGFSGGDTNEATAIALNAAKKELDRITPLYKEGIVSQKDYNAAEQAYEQARASHSGSKSGSVATAPVSGSITQLLVQQGEYVTAGQPI
ncbi:efflux RND transporter periplasmic adaptor subunit, partial [uncultured Muribaculum sp.]|uniref:efflux RND transporter periplasmic adaptor subunit n=1 Tax=uncultured Muribaculum sp. TaxID=1918613 RepID=UPI0026E2936D